MCRGVTSVTEAGLRVCARVCVCGRDRRGGVGAGRSKCGEGLAAVPGARGTCGLGQFGGRGPSVCGRHWSAK